MNIYGTNQAAKYLGVHRQTIAYHVYETENLKPDGKLGHDIYFTRATLDAFKAAHLANLPPEPRRPGRPAHSRSTE